MAYAMDQTGGELIFESVLRCRGTTPYRLLYYFLEPLYKKERFN